MRFNPYLLIILFMPSVADGAYIDSIPVRELQEITVNSDRILHKDGHEILLLDSRNRNFGTNALDAVSSLSRFITNLNGDKLTSWDRSEVFILINGIPSTAMDLRSYKGSDIKNVEYYAQAPAQYMGFTEGPLVNIVLKKKHDRLYRGYINAVNSVTTGFGTDQIDLSYSDSLNQIKAGYLIDYRDEKDISEHSEYEYIPAWSSTYDNRKRYKGQYHSFYGSYQHYRTNHLFNAKISFITAPKTQTSRGNMTSSEGGYVRDSPDSSLLKTGSKTTSIDLYYNHVLKNGSVIGVNVVNTLGQADTRSEITSPVSGQVSSLATNRSYSFIAHAFFVSKLLGWQYMLGSRYEYKQLIQESSGMKSRPYSHREFVSLGFSRSLGNWSLAPSLGLNVLDRSDGHEATTYVLPYFRMYADWWPEGSLKGFTVQLTMLSRHSAPQLSMMTESYVYRDYHFLAVGNPYLKNSLENSARLFLGYFIPGRKDHIDLMGSIGYNKNPVASILKVDGGNAYLIPSNLDHSFLHRIDLSGSWYPVPWLEISPYMEYFIRRYDASSRVRASYLRYGSTVAATFGNVTIIGAANSPTRDFDGDLTVDGSAQYAAVVQYKYREWSFGAEYHYLGHNNSTYGEAGGFRMLEVEDWQPLHTMFSLTATYSFSVGRSRRHGSKMISESSDDNGLTRYNTPQELK